MKRMFAVAAATVLLAVPAGAQVGRNQAVLNPDLASDAEIGAVPHMTPTLVAGILERRPFGGMLDLNAYLSQTLSAEQLGEVYRRMFLPVNIVSATPEELLLIPGAGRRMSREFQEYRPWDGGLVRFRREIGKYVDSTEVARLEQYVFIPINLNTASDDDILTIPGVGRRMLREFREYRPWTSFEQFRREIGKYVNAREVARLERYVTIN